MAEILKYALLCLGFIGIAMGTLMAITYTGNHWRQGVFVGFIGLCMFVTAGSGLSDRLFAG